MTVHNPKPLPTEAYNHMRFKRQYKTSINFGNNCSSIEQLLNGKRRVINWKADIQDYREKIKGEKNICRKSKNPIILIKYRVTCFMATSIFPPFLLYLILDSYLKLNNKKGGTMEIKEFELLKERKKCKI